MFVSFKEITWWILVRETMLAIEASMVARVTAAAVRESCTTVIEEDSKAEGKEKIWGFTTTVEKASKAEGGEEVYTIGWNEESIKEKKKF